MLAALDTVFRVTTMGCWPDARAGAVQVSDVEVGVPTTGQAAPPTVAVAAAAKLVPVMTIWPPARGRNVADTLAMAGAAASRDW